MNLTREAWLSGVWLGRAGCGLACAVPHDVDLAGLGKAGLGVVRQGMAVLVPDLHAGARLGSARLGLAGRGVARQGSVWLGEARHGQFPEVLLAALGVARLGWARLGGARQGTAGHGGAWAVHQVIGQCQSSMSPRGSQR